MRARDIMTSPVVTVTPETPIRRAARLLAEHGFTSLPVVDDDERLVGIVTEADLSHGRVPSTERHHSGRSRSPVPPTTVGEVMTAPAVTMDDDEDVSEHVSAKPADRVRAMPIVDSGGALVGIVTRRDVVRTLARSNTAIERDVRRRLACYGRPDRWTVTVHDGVASIVDSYDDATDRHVATYLAESVPGVTHAETTHRNEP